MLYAAKNRTVADAVVQDWILKHGAPISLHSDRGRELTTELQQGVCDVLRIANMHLHRLPPSSQWHGGML